MCRLLGDREDAGGRAGPRAAFLVADLGWWQRGVRSAWVQDGCCTLSQWDLPEGGM